MKTHRLTGAMLAAALLAAALPSCLDTDGTDNLLYGDTAGQHSLAIGTLKVIAGRDYYFDLDEGTRMYPADTAGVHGYAAEDGQRAFVYFDILPQKRPGYDYDARILRIENIPTKDVCFMTPEMEDSVGHDPVNITDMWIANGHLNVKYQIRRSEDPPTEHTLSLTADEGDAAAGGGDYLMLELRHNARGDTGGETASGMVSFRLKNIEQAARGRRGVDVRTLTLFSGVRHQTADFP